MPVGCSALRHGKGAARAPITMKVAVIEVKRTGDQDILVADTRLSRVANIYNSVNEHSPVVVTTPDHLTTGERPRRS